MSVLQIDLETYSSVDLLKSGVHRYVEASDFEIHGDEQVTVIDLTAFEDIPDEVQRDLINPAVTKHSIQRGVRADMSRPSPRAADAAGAVAMNIGLGAYARAAGEPGGVAEVL